MNRYDIEKSMERSRRMFAIFQGIVIAFIAIVAVVTVSVISFVP